MLHAVVGLSTKRVDRKYLYKKAIFRFSVKVLGSRILKSRHCGLPAARITCNQGKKDKVNKHTKNKHCYIVPAQKQILH